MIKLGLSILFISFNAFTQQFETSYCPISRQKDCAAIEQKSNDYLIGPIQSPLYEWPEFMSQFKDWKQLDVYTHCYRSRRGNYTLNDKQRTIIDETAYYYKLPVALLTCVLFIESRFNTQTSNKDSDKGIAQVTDPALRTLKNIINGPSKKDVEACHLRLTQNISDKERAYCNTVLELDSYNYQNGVWRPFLDQLKSDGLMSNYSFNRFDPYEPIVLAGFYIRHILDTSIMPFLPDKKLNFNEHMKTYQMTIAGYNMGPTKLRGLLRNANTTNIHKLHKSVQIINSTNRYMEGLKSCMTSNNFTAPPSDKNYQQLCNDIVEERLR